MNNPVHSWAKAMNNSFQKMKYMWPIDEKKKNQHPTSEKCKSKVHRFLHQDHKATQRFIAYLD